MIDRPYSCPACGETFVGKMTLARHVKGCAVGHDAAGRVSTRRMNEIRAGRYRPKHMRRTK